MPSKTRMYLLLATVWTLLDISSSSTQDLSSQLPRETTGDKSVDCFSLAFEVAYLVNNGVQNVASLNVSGKEFGKALADELKPALKHFRVKHAEEVADDVKSGHELLKFVNVPLHINQYANSLGQLYKKNGKLTEDNCLVQGINAQHNIQSYLKNSKDLRKVSYAFIWGSFKTFGGLGLGLTDLSMTLAGNIKKNLKEYQKKHPENASHSKDYEIIVEVVPESKVPSSSSSSSSSSYSN